MSSVGKILQVKQVHGPNEIIFADGTIQYSAWTGVAPSPACPLIIDCTAGVPGSTAIGITGVGGATSCDIKENGDFTYGEQGAGLNLVYNDVRHTLTCGSTALNGDVADCSIDTGLLPADDIPAFAGPIGQQIYQSSCERGIIRNPNQSTLNSSATNFPTEQENVFAGDAQCYNLTGSNTSLCRIESAGPLGVGLQVAVPFGDKVALADQCYFDGTQCRGGYIAPKFFRVEIPAQYQHGYFRFGMYLEGTCNPTNRNILRAKVIQYRLGVSIKEFKLGEIHSQTGSPRDFCTSFSRDVFGKYPAEEILTGDELEWVVENDAGSTDAQNLDLIQGVFEVVRAV